MKKLSEYYTKLLNLKFPDSNIENDDLADFYSELVEVDGYYAGLIKAALATGFESKKNFNFSHLKNLRNKFNSINKSSLSESDRNRYRECSDYLDFLEKLPSC